MNPIKNPVIIRTEVKFRRPNRKDRKPATPYKLRKCADVSPLYVQDRELYDLAKPIFDAAWTRVKTSHWESPLKFNKVKFFSDLEAAMDERGWDLELMHSFGQAREIGWTQLDWIWIGRATVPSAFTKD